MFFRYREVCDTKYRFDTENGAQKAGHFTQVVWKGSKDLGVGVAIREKKPKLTCAFVVTRYRNAGNILGLFTEKVQKGSFDKSICDKVVNMAESAVKEVDSSFEHAEDQMSEVTKTQIGKSKGQKTQKPDANGKKIDKGNHQKKESHNNTEHEENGKHAVSNSNGGRKEAGGKQTGRWEGLGSNDSALTGFFDNQGGHKNITNTFKGL